VTTSENAPLDPQLFGAYWTWLRILTIMARLSLRQIVEVKKLTKFFSQFSLGNYSIRHEFQALLLDL